MSGVLPSAAEFSLETAALYLIAHPMPAPAPGKPTSASVAKPLNVPTEFRSYRTIEVAKRLGVSLQTVQRWVDSGQLKAWKTLGGHRRIDADSAEALFRTQTPEALAANEAAAVAPAERRVLVVDDDPLDLELMTALVRQLLPDASIAVATDGFQALLMVGRSPPGVLITDVNMPHMDGFEMLRSLAESTLTSPSTIVAVSSLSPSDLAARGRLLPGVHFLSKPVDRQRLGILLGAASPSESNPVAKA